jgi:3-phenylpropionate/cinnamic acid dioxygenase small subunit
MEGNALPPSDQLAIHALMALYGHVIDERDWDQMSSLFTADVVYDMTDFDLGCLQGIPAIRTLWIEQAHHHPLAHHATNILIYAESADLARVLSKGLGVGAGGRVGSVVYRDVVRREAHGWRIASRTGTLRRPAPKS